MSTTKTFLFTVELPNSDKEPSLQLDMLTLQIYQLQSCTQHIHQRKNIIPTLKIPDHSRSFSHSCCPPLTMVVLLPEHRDGRRTLAGVRPPLLPIPCQIASQHPETNTYKQEWPKLDRATAFTDQRVNFLTWLQQLVVACFIPLQNSNTFKAHCLATHSPHHYFFTPCNHHSDHLK